MQLLIQKATVVHPLSPFNGEQVDLFIEDGTIRAIGSPPEISRFQPDEIIQAEGLCVSPGWFDVGIQVGDPGFEDREDLESAAAAARAGGFTGVGVWPNSRPVVHSKSEVMYMLKNTRDALVDFYPIGAVSRDCAGVDITEMYDMYDHGAVAFSDGRFSIQNDGLMLRALQYVRLFDGVIMNHPHQKAVAPGGQMHEGKTSTSMGLKGIPTIAETLMLVRDIYLTEYTGSRLHVINVSSAEGVEIIRKAKKKGLNITASVAAMNLVFEDTDLADFDPNLKVWPPLRSAADRKALIRGLKDGTLDCITSNHTPLTTEEKDLEFFYAEYGAIGLETTFGAVCSVLEKEIGLSGIVEKMAVAPRRIFRLPVPEIKVGAPANLTLFAPQTPWSFTEENRFSKSKNSPFFGRTLQGKPIGVVHNKQTWFSKRD
ncbi:MAG: dihydroorotase [Bacteroidetes bacterium]|nr:MAG: dihydroorotase [Bacteroidota bacterium]